MRHEKSVSVSKIRLLWEPWEEDETPRKHFTHIYLYSQHSIVFLPLFYIHTVKGPWRRVDTRKHSSSFVRRKKTEDENSSLCYSKFYIPSTLNTELIHLAATIDFGWCKMLNHGFKSWVFIFHFHALRIKIHSRSN